MERRSIGQSALSPLLAGGIMVTLVGVFADMRGTVMPRSVRQPHEVCDGAIHSEVVISREQLAQLLVVPERDSKAKVITILSQPYCQLPSIEVRAGVAAERTVYPLAFDPQTRLVVLYEGDEYAGYRFSVQ